MVAPSRRFQRDLRRRDGAALHSDNDLLPGYALARQRHPDLVSLCLGGVSVHLGSLSRSPHNICKHRPCVLENGLIFWRIRMNFQQLANKALEGILPERAELQAVLDATDEQMPEL